MERLRLVFMGTPAFAVPALEALIDAGHEIAAVYCRAPRPAGRGRKPRPSAVEQAARRAGLSIRAPESLGGAGAAADLAALGADAGVVVAYGLILPPSLLAVPRLGFVNAHASLLPRWRGAAPIQRAILAGDAETGLTIIKLDAGLDTGPILLARRLPIAPDATAGSLARALAELAGPLLVGALDGLAAGRIAPEPQPAAGASHAPKIEKAEACIDWSKTAVAIDRQVRALNPAPGAYFEWKGTRIKLLAVAPASARASARPGTVLDERLAVACGPEGGEAIRLARLQRAGRRPAQAPAFLRGFPIPAGSRLEGP